MQKKCPNIDSSIFILEKDRQEGQEAGGLRRPEAQLPGVADEHEEEGRGQNRQRTRTTGGGQEDLRDSQF